MKKYLLMLIPIIFLININVFASTFTYVRNGDNLRVPSDVVVDNNNIDSIMKTPSVRSDEKIYDFAGVLTTKEEDELYKSIKEYIKDSKIDSVIVTTRDLNGFDINEYTYNFYDYNDFLEDGVIFVIYMNGNTPEIFMGTSGNKNEDSKSKVFSIYSNYRIKETLKYVYEKNLRGGDYYKACDNYIKIIKGFYNIDVNSNYRVDENGNLQKNIPWVELMVLSVTLTFIISIILLYSIGMFKKEVVVDCFDNCIVKSTMKVKRVSEELIDTIQGGKK